MPIYKYLLNKLKPALQGKKLLFMMICFLIPQVMFGVVKLPKLVANGMILQRNTVLPVWGTAAVGETVTVNFKGQTFSTVTPASGRWKINIGPYTASTTASSMVVTGTSTYAPITVSNILIGDVYLCAGQSNMALQFNYTTASTLYAPEIAASLNSNIRQFKLNFALNSTPQADILATPYGWQSAAPANMKHFSMVAYFFAKSLYEKYNVPIGIINSTYNGTIIEAWISHEGLINFPDLYNQQPTNVVATNPSYIYNAMISPLLNYEIKGMLWYQGENNALSSPAAARYRELLPAFISDMRAKYNKPNLPFLYVQLANYSSPEHPQPISKVSELRESQAASQNISNVAMVVSHETSLAGIDIHPIHKKPVGDRLSLAAQKIIYGENVNYISPSYLSSVVSGNKMVVTFKNVGAGLIKHGSVINQFTIAGADKVYKAATATIIANNKIEVSATTVPNPAYVRYAWADNPRNANLYSVYGADSLPLQSFRSEQVTTTPPATGYVAQPFTAGNLVVTRYGDGSALPAINTTIPIFLDEFNTSGTSSNVNRPMPGLADSYDPNGINNLAVGTHSFGAEAMLSLSENKKFLSFAANNKLVGEPVNSTGSKTIAVLTADGGLNTNTTANLGVARTATVNNDLSRIYYISQVQGLSYVPYETTNANVVLAAGENGYRSVAIYGGQLYTSTSISAATANYPEVTRQVSRVGTGMPTSGTQTLTPLPGLPTNEVVRQFALLSSAGNTVLDLFYGVTESGKLIKYKLVSGTWVSRGSVNITNVVSLAAKMSGTTAQLYSTTLNSSTYASTLVKVDDAAAATSTLATNAVNVLATSATNTYFKGVAFAPENSTSTLLSNSTNSLNSSMSAKASALKTESTSLESSAFRIYPNPVTDGVFSINAASVNSEK
ncbi:MAG: hypothetical protein EOP54_12755, partial [Sphingobacteriales bacterium]